MSEIKLTVSQVAQEIGESVHTVRNWLKDFRQYIPIEKSGSGYNLFGQDGINALLKIKKMYREQSLSTKQIQAIMSGADKPTVQDEPAQVVESVRQLIEEQRRFNESLLQRIDDHIKRRDEQLMFILREIQERKQLPGRRRSWLKRWLSD